MVRCEGLEIAKTAAPQSLTPRVRARAMMFLYCTGPATFRASHICSFIATNSSKMLVKFLILTKAVYDNSLQQCKWDILRKVPSLSCAGSLTSQASRGQRGWHSFKSSTLSAVSYMLCIWLSSLPGLARLLPCCIAVNTSDFPHLTQVSFCFK